MSKVKTNRQVLGKLIKEADDMTLVFIRERLLNASDQYKDEGKVMANWNMPMFHPSIYINAAKEVREAIDFTD